MKGTKDQEREIPINQHHDNISGEGSMGLGYRASSVDGEGVETPRLIPISFHLWSDMLLHYTIQESLPIRPAVALQRW